VLQAVATDNRGANQHISAGEYTVSNRPPAVTLTSPTNNAVFIEGDVIALAATASDLDGTNLVVQFLAGTNVLFQITNGPYTFNWSNAVAGNYAIAATATDTNGAVTTAPWRM
jgi:hypothetical protein